VVVFGLMPVLCSEREGRSSFFNRAAGVKKVFPLRFQENSASTLEACHWRSIARLTAVSSSGLSRSARKRHLCGIGSGLSR
jgi:hypothetical protein